MELKKKSRNLLKYFCRISNVVLLFMVFLGCSSHCFASFSDDFSSNEVQQINNFFNFNLTVDQVNDCYQKLKRFYPTIDKRNVLILRMPYLDNTYSCSFCFLANNGTFGDIPYVYFYSISGSYYFFQADSSTEILNNSYYVVQGYVSNNRFDNSVGSRSYVRCNPSDDVSNFYTSFPALDDSLLTWNAILTTMPTQAFYYKNPNNNIISAYMSTNYIILDDYIPDQPSGDTPVEPSGDTPINPSGDSGGGSVIDYTNQLNNINTSINNVNNSVQNVQNQISGDTQKITNSIDNLNNTLTSPADMDNTTITSGDIERCFRF